MNRRTAIWASARYRSVGKGICKWCGGLILREDGDLDRRRTWHRAGRDYRDCIGEYLMQSQQYFREQVWKRDGGVCAECPPGTGPHRRWSADHVVPLWAEGTWTLDNAQTLCDEHHKAKTSREAGERAAARRPADDEQLALVVA